MGTLKSTKVKYAVKIVDKKFIVRHNKQKYVMNEKACLSRLEHESIIKLFYTFHDDDHLCMKRLVIVYVRLDFVLELASGGELFELIRSFGRLPLYLTQFFAAELVDTLEYLHAQRICHRDLKPENILLNEHHKIKLTDFGTAKSLDDLPAPVVHNERGSIVRKNSFVGTAEYVAPEILRGEAAGMEYTSTYITIIIL